MSTPTTHEYLWLDDHIAKSSQCLSIAIENIQRAEDTIHRAVGHTYSDGQWSGTLEEAFVFALRSDALNYSDRIRYTNALVERKHTIELRDKQEFILRELLAIKAEDNNELQKENK